MTSPCTKDCPDRKGGCAVTCPMWAEYLVERDKIYAQKKQATRLRDYEFDKKVEHICKNFRHRRK